MAKEKSTSFMGQNEFASKLQVSRQTVINREKLGHALYTPCFNPIGCRRLYHSEQLKLLLMVGLGQMKNDKAEKLWKEFKANLVKEVARHIDMS